MDNNILLIIGIIIVIVVLTCSNSQEGYDKLKNKNKNKNKSKCSYNPRKFYPIISDQSIGSNYIPLPEKVDYPWSQNTGNYGEADIIDDGSKGNLGLNWNMCSKSCCSVQYPPSFSVTPDDYVLMSDEDYVPSNYTCNNGWQDSGCLCLTKEQALHLNRRGGNAYQNV